MNILALDQSTNVTGVAVLDSHNKLLYYTVINLFSMPKNTDQDQANKRQELLHQIDEIIKKYNIQMVITEGVYFNSNADTHRKLAQCQGAVQDFCCRIDKTCFSWKCAGEWRKWIGITAKKREDYKVETKKYIIEKYKLTDNLAEDIYDAVGIGMAYFRMLEQKGIK